MFIVWGTKVVRRNLGRVAHLCPLCREIRSFRLTRVESVGHLYYIPLGRRTIHGLVKECETCGVKLDASDEEADSALFVGRNDWNSLIAAAHPDIVGTWEKRQALYERAASKSLTAGERVHLIREPFLLVEPSLRDRLGTIQFDRVSGLLGLATILVPLGLALAAGYASKALSDGLIMLALGFGGIFLVATIIALATDGRRFRRRKVFPVLTRALRPLDPSREELEQELVFLRGRGHKVGKKIKPEELWDEIHSGSAS